MPNDEVIFDRVMSKEGYWPHDESGDPRLTQVLEHARGYAAVTVTFETTKPGTPIPYVNVSEDEKINALAFHEDGRDYIALTRGAIEAIDTLFLTLLSFRAIFPDVGNASEMVDPSPWDALPLDWSSPTPRPIPQDRRRGLLAMVLSAFVIDYLIFHEIGHIWRGHLRLPGSVGGKPLLKEVTGSGTATAEQLLFEQSLEVDADSFAVATMLLNIKECVTGKGAYAKIATELGWTLEDAVRFWLFAIYSFHRLFSNGPPDLGKLASQDHPLPRVRQAWIIQTIAAHCVAGRLGMSKREFVKIANSVSVEAEEAFALLLNQTAEATDFVTKQDPLIDKHLGRIQRILDKLKPSFNELGYGIWKEQGSRLMITYCVLAVAAVLIFVFTRNNSS